MMMRVISGVSGLNEIAPRVSASGASAATTSNSISPPSTIASGVNCAPT